MSSILRIALCVYVMGVNIAQRLKPPLLLTHSETSLYPNLEAGGFSYRWEVTGLFLISPATFSYPSSWGEPPCAGNWLWNSGPPALCDDTIMFLEVGELIFPWSSFVPFRAHVLMYVIVSGCLWKIHALLSWPHFLDLGLDTLSCNLLF